MTSKKQSKDPLAIKQEVVTTVTSNEISKRTIEKRSYPHTKQNPSRTKVSPKIPPLTYKYQLPMTHSQVKMRTDSQHVTTKY